MRHSNDSDPPDLLARPGPDDPLRYHVSQAKAAHECNAPARAAYHAGWVRHLRNTRDADSLPTVSVVIPLYNRARLVVEAVRSCLEQDYPRVEVIVVDDGSTDAPEKSLKSLAGRIRLVRQENQGVSAARNHGLRIAKTDFVHFLDSDDYLKPDAISAKVAAFRAVADAEVCTSLYECSGTNSVASAATHEQPPLGDENCPTLDLLNTVVQRFPMVNCTVLAPRWVWLDTGLFDEDLPQAEDVRYWFRMAMRGTKVIGLKRPLTVIRFTDNSLTTNRRENLGYYFQVTLANLQDLLSTPPTWPYVGRFLSSLWPESMQSAFECPNEALRLKRQVAGQIGRLHGTAHDHGLSAAPLARVIRRFCRQESVGELFEEAMPELSELIRRATPIGSSDANLWLSSELPDACSSCNKPALAAIAWEQGRFGSILGRLFGWLRAA